LTRYTPHKQRRQRHQEATQPLQEQNGEVRQLSLAGRWAVYEWFYPDVDRPYFQQNEFQDCLNELGLSKVRKLARLEWSHIRSVMGKPRRLSAAFLKQERAKLGSTRINIRRLRSGRGPLAPTQPIGSDPIPQDIPPRLPVGAHVLAYLSHTIQRGIVHHAEEDGSRYKVLFEGSSFLSTLQDIDLMSVEPEELEAEEPIKTPSRTPRGSQRDHAPASVPSTKRRKLELTPVANDASRKPITPRVFTPDELRNVASLFHLLQNKQEILVELTAMNNQAEKMDAQSQEYPEWFQRRYAVLIVALEHINQPLEPALLLLHAARTSPAIQQVPHHHFNRSELSSPYKGTASAPIIIPSNTTSTTTSSLIDRPDWAKSTVIECRKQAREIVGELQGEFSVAPSMREYVLNCTNLLMQIKACTERVRTQGSEEVAEDISTMLSAALTTIQPKSEENQPLFQEIEQAVNMLKSMLTSQSHNS